MPPRHTVSTELVVTLVYLLQYGGAFLDQPGSGCLRAELTHDGHGDPTNFTFTCSWDTSLCSSSEPPNVTMTFVGHSERPLAHQHTYLSGRDLSVDDLKFTYGSTSALGSSSKISITTEAGTCADAGVYRCKMVYRPPGSSSVQVAVDEARLPSCNPGAVSELTLAYNHYMCRADPPAAYELISLEVSTVSNYRRTRVAFVNKFLNEGVAVSPIGVYANGYVHPHNATQWFLELNTNTGYDEPTWVTVGDVVSCKAVYFDSASGKMVMAFEDKTMPASV